MKVLLSEFIILSYMKYESRERAGELLGNYLKENADFLEDALLLAIPRGGVPVAYNVAQKLQIPFHIVITKKITSPENPEFAIGAIAPDGSYEVNRKMLSYLNISQNEFEAYKDVAYEKVIKRVKKYANGEIPILTNKNVFIIDDGIATGFTALVAAKFARNLEAKNVILAVPVSPADSKRRLGNRFDEVYCPNVSQGGRFAVGMFYIDFHQNTDKELFSYLDLARKKNLLYDKTRDLTDKEIKPVSEMKI